MREQALHELIAKWRNIKFAEGNHGSVRTMTITEMDVAHICADELEAVLGASEPPMRKREYLKMQEPDAEPRPQRIGSNQGTAETPVFAPRQAGTPTEAAGGAQLRGEDAWLDELVGAALGGTQTVADRRLLRDRLRTILRAFAANTTAPASKSRYVGCEHYVCDICSGKVAASKR